MRSDQGCLQRNEKFEGVLQAACKGRAKNSKCIDGGGRKSRGTGGLPDGRSAGHGGRSEFRKSVLRECPPVLGAELILGDGLEVFFREPGLDNRPDLG